MTAASANVIRTPQEWARILGGDVMPNGRTIRFPRPGGKSKDRSCTLTVGSQFPDGVSVADGKISRTTASSRQDLQALPIGAHIRAIALRAAAIVRGQGLRLPVLAGRRVAALLPPFSVCWTPRRR
jgi:hypothetical protein